MPDIAHDFRLPITSEKVLKDYLRLAFGVQLPDKAVCPGHVSPFRAFADAYFARSRIAVWKASRGLGGKSFMLAALRAVETSTLPADVTILGGSGEQAQRIIEHQARLWNYRDAPRYLLQDDPTARAIRFITGNKVLALTASTRSARGPHPQRLRLDEVDEMDLKILDAALGQPMAKPGIPVNVVESSTHQYADGVMSEVLKRAEIRDHPVYEWCWRETSVDPIYGGWLTSAMVEDARSLVTAEMWRTEYDLQEPAPGARAIMPEAVKAMFKPDWGEYMGNASEYIEYERPVPEGQYAHGADWAKSEDWTIIITLRTDVKPYRLVAFGRFGRTPYPVMVQALDHRIERYGINRSKSLHDATGIGGVINDYLKYSSTGYIMIGKDRTELLSDYIAAIERGEIVSPDIAYMRKEHNFASMDDVFGSGHLPDTMSAGALAYRAAQGLSIIFGG